jgi:hypothetical protein
MLQAHGGKMKMYNEISVYRIEKSIKEGVGPQRTVESHRKNNEIKVQSST